MFSALTVRHDGEGRWTIGRGEDRAALTAAAVRALTAQAEAPEQMHWTGIVAVEGRPTGDGRQIEQGALDWETPLPLTWRREGGGHEGAVVVGTVWHMRRDGEAIRAEGTFDLGSDEGRESARHVAETLTDGASMELDAVEAELRVRADVLDDGERPDISGQVDDDGRIVIDEYRHDDWLEVTTAGRIRTVAQVTTPAFDETVLELADGVTLDDLLAGRDAPNDGDAGLEGEVDAFAAVAAHETGTSDDEWDGAAAEAALPSPMMLSTARAAYAWVDDDAVTVEDGEEVVTKEGSSFIHHEVGENAQPGPANTTACSTGIGVLNGGRGVDPSEAPWGGDREGIHAHLAAHLRDAGVDDDDIPELMDLDGADEQDDEGQEPAMAATTSGNGDAPARPLRAREPAPVVASADERGPRRDWFRDPEFGPEGEDPRLVEDESTGIWACPPTITADGFIFGHTSPHKACHIGYTDRCVTPPRDEGLAYLLTGEAILASGERVSPTAVLTMDTDHPSVDPSVDWRAASRHYADTGCQAADLTLGYDEYGVWFAGAVRPDVMGDDAKLRRLVGSQVSPDWRPIGGRARMVGLLAVNHSGFPIPKQAMAASAECGECDDVLVRMRDGEVQAMVACGMSAPVRLAADGSQSDDVGAVLSRVERTLARMAARDLARELRLPSR